MRSNVLNDPETMQDKPEGDLPQTPTEEAAEEVRFNEPLGAGVEAPDVLNSAPDSQELLEARNHALRAYADLDNYKKRFDREIARIRDLERERFLNEALGIADNLRRALNVKGAENSPYREGLMSVVRQIDNLLKNFGAEPIPAEKGQPMDANVHEAVTAIPAPGAAHETILEVVEPGYTIGERVLRPAKVVVARSDD